KRRAAVVRRNGKQPGTERPWIVVLPPLHPHLQKHFLKQLFALVRAMHHAADVGEQAAGMAAHQRRKAIAPPAGDLAHQPFVGFLSLAHSHPPWLATTLYAPCREDVE